MFRSLRNRVRFRKSSICPKSWSKLHVRPMLEFLEDRRVPTTWTVYNTNDSGTGSFRQAILDANAHPGSTIVFNLDEGNVIAPATPLPAITSPVVINGTTNPSPHIVGLDGGSVSGQADGLTIDANGCTILG